MDEPGCPGCAALRKEVDALRAQNAELTRRLEESQRAGKRQAAPFRKGPPKLQPKTPGRKSAMRYVPDLSVVAVRTLSIRASLAASTATPGSMAPDVSRTAPAIVLWALARAGNTRSHEKPRAIRWRLRDIATLARAA